MRTGPGAATTNTVRHARVRALERYGLDLSAMEMLRLETRLAAGEGMILKRFPADGTEVRVIRLQGRLVSLVYGVSGYVHTFLPPDAPFKRSWRTPR